MILKVAADQESKDTVKESKYEERKDAGWGVFVLFGLDPNPSNMSEKGPILSAGNQFSSSNQSLPSVSLCQLRNTSCKI